MEEGTCETGSDGYCVSLGMKEVDVGMTEWKES